MYGQVIANKPIEENSADDMGQNSSVIGVAQSFKPRRESKIWQGTKIMRAQSLIEDADQGIVLPRLRERSEFKDIKWVIFPDDTLKILWDLLIVIIMFYTIIVVPYRIAFTNNDSNSWSSFDIAIDCIFMVDVVANCFTAFYLNEEEVECSLKLIFLNYLKTWMVFDVLASFPFQEIFSDSSWNSLAKIGRISRLYRLIKLAKLVRLLKSQQGVQNLVDFFGMSLKVPVGVKRLLYFLFVFSIVCHLIACLWYFISTFDINQNNNWVTKYGKVEETDYDLYIASLYWTITTLTTVGYGDITANNNVERVVCIFVMLGGVFFYSYTVGTITSLMGEIDRNRTKLENKLLILKDISNNYPINRRFFKKLKKALEYDQSRFTKECESMIACLPKKLGLTLKLVMNRKLIEKNKFFDNKSIPFINQILTHLRPYKFMYKEYIIHKGDYSNEMFFVTDGEIGIFEEGVEGHDILIDSIKEGDFYGDVGVILSEPHEFSAKATKESQLLALTRDDLFLKILNYFGDDLKTDLIEKTTERKNEFIEKRDEAVSKYYRGKIIQKTLNRRRQISEVSSASETKQASENANRLNKIRNTLSKKTISMLEVTAGSEIDKIKNDIKRLTLGINNLKEKVQENRKKYTKPAIERKLKDLGHEDVFIRVNKTSEKIDKVKSTQGQDIENLAGRDIEEIDPDSGHRIQKSSESDSEESDYPYSSIFRKAIRRKTEKEEDKSDDKEEGMKEYKSLQEFSYKDQGKNVSSMSGILLGLGFNDKSKGGNEEDQSKVSLLASKNIIS